MLDCETERDTLALLSLYSETRILSQAVIE